MVKTAALSALRHAATALAGTLVVLQGDPLQKFNLEFVDSLMNALLGAALAGVVRFLQRVGEPALEGH